MSEGRVSTEFLLFFAPEQWTAVTKFRLFMGPPFEVSRELSKGANTADNHLAKFNVLAGLARRLKEQLAEDEAELAERGHSSARRSKEFAALVEALFCELYAALDGVRRDDLCHPSESQRGAEQVYRSVVPTRQRMQVWPGVS